MSNNFWDQIETEPAAPPEVRQEPARPAEAPAPLRVVAPEEEPDRPLSYLDVTPQPLVQKTPRQRIMEYLRSHAPVRSHGGTLIQDLSNSLGLTEALIWRVLNDMSRKGTIDLIMAGKQRVYSVHLIDRHAITDESEWQPVSGETTEAPVNETPKPDDRLAGALAAELWLRYEQAVEQVGMLSDQLEAANARIAELEALVAAKRGLFGR